MVKDERRDLLSKRLWIPHHISLHHLVEMWFAKKSYRIHLEKLKTLFNRQHHSIGLFESAISNGMTDVMIVAMEKVGAKLRIMKKRITDRALSIDYAIERR